MWIVPWDPILIKILLNFVLVDPENSTMGPTIFQRNARTHVKRAFQTHVKCGITKPNQKWFYKTIFDNNIIETPSFGIASKFPN